MTARVMFAVGALAAAGALAGCASQVSPADPVYQKLDALQQEVNQMPHGQGLMGMASQQQQLQQQISTLQGQVQDLQHQLQQSQSRQQLVNRDFDQRLSALGQSSNLSSLNPGAAAPSGNYFPTGPIPQAAPQQASVPTAAPVAVSAGAGAGAPQGSDSQAYQAAFDKLRGGNYSAAIKGFDGFIKQYPSSSYVPNAWYWMGETHYVNGEYKQAINNFQQVITQYPSSSKASDAYLKMGYAQYALKDYTAAQTTFKGVISHYPGTTAANLAQQRLQQMGAQGQ